MSTEKQLRNSVVTIARGWLGYGEGTGNFKVILDTYNRIRPLPVGYKVKGTDDWCAAFVSAVGWKAGLSDVILPECSCPRMLELYRKTGCWMERDGYVPLPGDLILYDWEDDGRRDCVGQPNHVGIVASVSGNTVQVIEGNKNQQVGIRCLKLNGKFIRGYCLPDYKSKAKEDEDMDQATFDKMMDNYLERRGKEGASAWAVNTVKQARNMGIMDGSRPKMFATREECVQMILNAKGE